MVRIMGVLTCCAILAAAGCGGNTTANSGEVPAPVNLLLPEEIKIHNFTGTRTFDPRGGLKGIEARIEARDHFGDPNREFGQFRFELYDHRPQASDPKGQLLVIWDEDLTDPKKNQDHWDATMGNTYEFRLLWEDPIPVGQKFVLRVVFTSPFTPRLFDERTFVSGQ